MIKMFPKWWHQEKGNRQLHASVTNTLYHSFFKYVTPHVSMKLFFFIFFILELIVSVWSGYDPLMSKFHWASSVRIINVPLCTCVHVHARLCVWACMCTRECVSAWSVIAPFNQFSRYFHLLKNFDTNQEYREFNWKNTRNNCSHRI